MHAENPGFPAAGTSVHTVPAADSAVGMEEALVAAARLGLRLARGEDIGSAEDEGYLPRGIRYNETAELPTSRRAVDMVLRKIKGEPYRTELDVRALEEIAPPEPVSDLKKARIAIVSEGGMVPPGNPDRFAGSRNGNWAAYSFEGKDALPGGTLSRSTGASTPCS